MADLYYYETGYTDDGYFVYTANADAAPVATASVACEAGKITEVQSAISSSFSVSAIGSRNADIDLFAFSDAAIAVQVDRIRDTNIQATGIFDIATDFIRVKNSDADVDAIFSAVIDGLRSRDTIIETQAAFSFDVLAYRVKNITCDVNSNFSVVAEGSVTSNIIGESNQTSTFTLSATGNKIIDIGSNIYSNVEVNATISHIEGADLTAFNNVSLTAQTDRLRDTQSQSNAAFDLQSVATRIQQAQSNISSEATASLPLISVSKEFSVSIQSSVEVSATISHIEGADLFAFSQSNLSADISRTRDNQSQNTLITNVSIVFTKIQSCQATLVAASDVNVSVVRNRFVSIDCQSQSSISCSIDKIKNGLADFNSQASLSVSIGVIKQFTSTQSDNFAVSTIVYKIISVSSATNSSTALVAYPSIGKGATIIAFNFATMTILPFVVSRANANLVSESTTQTTIRKISGASISAATEFNVSSQAQRFRGNQSTCSSSFAVDISNLRIRYAQSSLESQFNLTAVIGKQQSIDLYAFSNNSLSANGVVFRNALSSISSVSSVSTTISKIMVGASVIQSQFNLQSNNVRVKFADSQMTAFGSVLNVIDVIPGVRIICGAVFDTRKPYVVDDYVDDDYTTNFETIANYKVDNLHQLSVISTMSVDADYAAQGAALLANSGTMTINAVKTASMASTQTSNTSINAVTNVKVDVIANANSQFTLFANIGTQEDIFVNMFDNVALTATVTKRCQGISNNNIVSTLYADTLDSLNIKGSATLSSNSQVTTQANRFRDTEIHLQALAFELADGDVQSSSTIICQAQFNVSANVIRRRQISSAASVAANLTSATNRIRQAQITISSAMTFVAEVRDLRLDEIEYIIPAEGWEYQIVGEDRTYDIIGETRLRKIVGETRNRSIDGETRIYIIE